MRTTFATQGKIAGTALMIVCCLAAAAFAQDSQASGPKPMYKVLNPRTGTEVIQPPVSVPTWKGSYSYQGAKYTETFVGTPPTASTSTTVPVYLIPVSIVITTTGGTKTYSPTHVLSNGNTVTQSTVLSPMFDATTTYTQGGVNVGTTQYIDAYQRANLWAFVKAHTGYHLLLGAPTITAVQTLSPPKADGALGNAFGVNPAGLVNINWFDPQAFALISKLGIPANALPIFLTYDVYLTNGSPTLFNCCIGGYHTYDGVQAYMQANYVDVVGAFSQDVSALSHEVGEWADDPLTTNNSPCGILENGDPLENNPNYGGFPYTVNGFTYNLQDLATLPYFGAPPTVTVNKWFTFQGEALAVCQNGP
jgi:hypothetical protein